MCASIVKGFRNYAIIVAFALSPALVQATHLVEIDPYVDIVLTDSSINPQGDFFRMVLIDSEIDGCVQIQRVNIRVPGPARVIETRRYCDFTKGSVEYSLERGRVADSEITEPKWTNHLLNFKMSYVEAAPHAERLELKCTLDPQKPGATFQCDGIE